MVETRNLRPIRIKYGIPNNLRSCHTAEIGDYFIEGHIPARDIKRLLQEKQEIKGLIVPGMPGGSPGMESSSYEPYSVLSMDGQGRIKIFSRH